MMALLKFGLAVLLTEAVAEILVESVLLDPLRRKLAGEPPKERKPEEQEKIKLREWLFWCGYCMSVWTGVGLAFAFEIRLPFEAAWIPWWLGTLAMGLAVHRLANWLHDAMRWARKLLEVLQWMASK